MDKYRCLIVEDEPLAAEVLTDYIGQVPFLELEGVCTDALYALETLKRSKIDLVFLDIHLPRMKGLEFLKTLREPPRVIITTAYHDYAVQGYELNVVDYLLKPISFNRFLAAINKLQHLQASAPGVPVEESGSIFVYVDKKHVRVRREDILFIESLKEYVRVHTATKTLITKMSLTAIEKALGKEKFIRTHRSYLVSIDRIDSYSATEVEVSGRSIPVGRNYRELVQAVLG